MRVLVCGSRHFNDYELLEKTLNELQGYTVLIEGGARGADFMAKSYGYVHGYEVETYPADWNTFGKRAGPIRNHQMLKEGKPDLVVAFLAPDSRGTKHMIEIAQKAGVEVHVVEIS